MPPTPLDITLVAPSKVYDATDTLTGLTVATVDPDPGAADISFIFSGQYEQSDVGAALTCTGVASIHGPDAGLFTVGSLTIPDGEITARPITITADDRTKMRTANDPPLTYAVTSGALQGSDALSGALTRDAGETVADYDITQGTLDDANYDITFVAAVLSIFALDARYSGVITEPLRYRILKASPPADGIRWSRWKRKGRSLFGS